MKDLFLRNNNYFVDKILSICSPISVVCKDRMIANIKCTEHILNKGICGDIIEVGVWRGGSLLSILMTLEEYFVDDRTIHLYDTFEGMTNPTDIDIDHLGRTADYILANDNSQFFTASLEEVRHNIYALSEYPRDKILFHKGDICKNTEVPKTISFLRLDTDWYESTKCELEQFYDNVSSNGIVLFDDYGHWKGCKKAVDEFLINKQNIKLITIDSTGRYFFKP